MSFKNYFISCLFIVFHLSLFAQDNHIKVYSNFLHTYTSSTPSESDFERKLLQFKDISLAYRKMQSENLFNQFEISVKFREKMYASHVFTQNKLTIQYERGKYFKKFKNDKFRLYAAGGVQLYNLYENFIPIATNAFSIKNLDMGITLNLITGLEYHFSQQFYAELGVNLAIFSGGYVYSQYQSPNISSSYQNFGGPDLSILNNRFFRLGLGYKFGKTKNILSIEDN